MFWALFPKPKGTIRQCSNLENHHPSATRFLASTLCALNINGENPFGCVTGWREGSERHQGTFQTRLLPFTTQWALELADTPADTQPFCRRDDQGGQEVPTSQGLFPAWWSDRQPHTPQNTLNTETLSPQRPDWDLCVCGCLAAEATTPLRGFQNPLWIIPRPSSSTSSQAQVDGVKACRSSRGWESVQVPSSAGKITEETGEQEHTWAATRVLADDGWRAAEDSQKPGRASPLRA